MPLYPQVRTASFYPSLRRRVITVHTDTADFAITASPRFRCLCVSGQHDRYQSCQTYPTPPTACPQSIKARVLYTEECADATSSKQASQLLVPLISWASQALTPASNVQMLNVLSLLRS